MSVYVDHKQVAHAALVLVAHNPSYKEDTENAVIQSIVEAVRDAVELSFVHKDTIIDIKDGYTIIVITRENELSGCFPDGITHMVHVAVDPSTIVHSCRPDDDADSAVTNVGRKPTCDVPVTEARYIHVRQYEYLLVGDTVVHAELSAYGGRTIAFVDNKDGTLTYASAKCHPRDLYVKKIGNGLAQQRLLNRNAARRVHMTINEFRAAVDDGTIPLD